MNEKEDGLDQQERNLEQLAQFLTDHQDVLELIQSEELQNKLK